MSPQAAPRSTALRHQQRVPNWVIGLIFAVLLVFGSYLAYTKELPFSDPGYELTATFENAATLRETAPVRIAGVNVGKVTDVSAKGTGAEVTFTVSEEGLPIHSDAEIEIRPRLFLEGNFFLDLKPGSPSAPELDDGGSISASRTATAVQLDEILTALQSDSREDLQQLLKGFGTALTYQPTPADDADQDPDVHGETAAESLNDAFRPGGPAGRDTAIVTDALRGQKEGDLFKLISAQARVFGELASREDDLKGLVTNFNITTGALASESANLSATIAELAPTLEQGEPSLRHLSDALPLAASVRARDRAVGPRAAGHDRGIRAVARADEPAAPRRGARRARRAAEADDAELALTADATAAIFPELRGQRDARLRSWCPQVDVVIDDDGGTYPYVTGEPELPTSSSTASPTSPARGPRSTATASTCA